MSNHEQLKSIVSSLSDTHSTQVSVARTRASLLVAKKLCDSIRKELLTHGKALKQARSKNPDTQVMEPTAQLYETQ